MKRANTMSTITVDLTTKVKTKFTSSNAEKTKWIHLTDVGNFHIHHRHRDLRIIHLILWRVFYRSLRQLWLSL